MEPANEHDPTMDAHIVHAVNVNNKKEVAEMRFLTKSLENARHVQENIYRHEERDLTRQLWKLHKEKERRHPELDYSRRSSQSIRRLSEDQIDGSHSSRHGSYNVLYHPRDRHHHPHAPPSHQQRVHDDKYSYVNHTGEIDHPTTSHHYQASRGAGNHHIPFSEANSSHHFVPVLHRHPEWYPHNPAHRGHLSGGYQPPVDIPGVVSQSSRLNAIVQPAGYGHSVAELAAHLGMHRHYHRGASYHRQSQMHPSQLTDDIRNIGSYESLTRYITLLDYQAHEEGKTGQHHLKGAAHRAHHKVAREQNHPHPHLREDRMPDNERSGVKVTEIIDEESPSDADKKQIQSARPKSGTQTRDQLTFQDDKATKTNGAKPKTIGFIGVPSETPSPIQAPKATTDGDRTVHHPTKKQGDARRDSHPNLEETEGLPRERSAEGVAADSKHPAGTEKEPVGVGVAAAKRSNGKTRHKSRDRINTQASQGQMLPHPSSHHEQHISRHTSSFAPVHPPLTKQILADLHTIATHPVHAATAHHQPRQQAPKTAAERKRLAMELLAREYPVLLRQAPTKFDPLDALMCRYLRLSSTNVDTLEEMCKEAGIDVGAHAHHQIDNVNEYVFGNDK